MPPRLSEESENLTLSFLAANAEGNTISFMIYNRAHWLKRGKAVSQEEQRPREFLFGSFIQMTNVIEKNSILEKQPPSKF